MRGKIKQKAGGSAGDGHLFALAGKGCDIIGLWNKNFSGIFGGKSGA
jgi:hypothetical protein